MLPLFEWEKSLFLKLNNIHHPLLNQLMVFLSGQMVWLFVISVVLFFLLKSKTFNIYWALFLILAIFVSDVTSSYFFKNVFVRLRPCRMEDIKLLINNFGQRCGGKFGFFSSHASNSFVLISFILFTLKPNRLLTLLLIFLGSLVSYSRIYLGVHFPLDVICGIIYGLVIGQVFALFYLHSVVNLEKPSELNRNPN